MLLPLGMGALVITFGVTKELMPIPAYAVIVIVSSGLTLGTMTSARARRSYYPQTSS
jgi:hypothetical protein